MRKAIYGTVAGVLLACAAWSVAVGQEAATGGAVRTIKVPVKHYKILSPADVYRAAIERIQADVRFRDAFAARTVVPDVVRQINLGDATYLAVLAFRTEGELLCLVPRASSHALRTLFGLPADWPLNDAVLNRPIVLNPGQQMTIEGTIIGPAVGERCVLVDSVLVGEAARAPAQREVQLLWRTQQEPRVISEPGEHEFVFPCTYVAGETATVKVSIKALRPRELQRELARLAAQTEGLRAEQKTYGQYSAGAVYRHAGQNSLLNVDFSDRAARIIGFSPPRLAVPEPRLRWAAPVPAGIAAAPALRGGVPAVVAIGYAFETANRITCLVPSDSASLMGRATSTLPGEQVHIRGTVTGVQGAYNCVLVDYIGFPEQEEAAGDGDTWWVSVEWPQERPKVLWDYGLYQIPLSCQHAAGRFEVVQVLLREFRTIEVEVPAAEPAAPAESAE